MEKSGAGCSVEAVASSSRLIQLDLGVRDEISKMAAEVEEKQERILLVEKMIQAVENEKEQLDNECGSLRAEINILSIQENAASAALKELQKHEAIQRSKNRALMIRLQKFQQRWSNACTEFVKDQNGFREQLLAQSLNRQECSKLILESSFMRTLKKPACSEMQPTAEKQMETAVKMDAKEAEEITVSWLKDADFDIMDAFLSTEAAQRKAVGKGKLSEEGRGMKAATEKATT